MVRLRTAQLGLAALALGAACNGPISDLPRAGEDTDRPGSPFPNDPSAGLSDAGRPPAAGGSTGGSGGLPSTDAGNVGWPTADGAVGWPTQDGAVFDGPDGGVPDAGDGGLEGGAERFSCLPVDSAAPSDVCRGSLCQTTLPALALASNPSGACATEAARKVACQGLLELSAAACGEQHVLSLGFVGAVTDCMAQDARLAQVSPGCLDCYAEELACALTSCLVECFDATQPSCAQCRAQECGDQLAQCSGLPVRSAP